MAFIRDINIFFLKTFPMHKISFLLCKFTFAAGIILIPLLFLINDSRTAADVFLYANALQSIAFSSASLFLLLSSRKKHARYTASASILISVIFIALSIYSLEQNFFHKLFQKRLSNIDIIFILFFFIFIIFNSVIYYLSSIQATPFLKYSIRFIVSISIAFSISVYFSHYYEYLYISRFSFLIFIIASGIFLIGSGILFMPFTNTNAFQNPLHHLGLVISAITFFFSTFFTNTMIFSLEKKIQKSLDETATNLAYMVNFEIMERVIFLNRIKDEMESHRLNSLNDWEQHFSGFLEEMPGLVSVKIINRDKMILQDESNLPHSISNSLLKKINFQNAIPYELKETNESFRISKQVFLIDSKNHILAFKELKKGKYRNHYLIGIFRIDDLMNYILSHLPHFFSYNIVLLRNGNILFHKHIVEPHAGSAVPLDFKDKWILAVQAGPDFLDQKKSPLSIIIFLGGLIISIMIALIFWLWSKDADKSFKYEKEKLKAESTNKAKSKFLSSMSHELRTPLNAILGFTQLMNTDKTLSENNILYLDTIRKAGLHLLHLINEMLDLSKIEAGKLSLKIQHVPCNAIIEDSINLVSNMAEENSISLSWTKCEESIYIHADQNRCRQVLVNLLTNAIKYNKNGGSVTLKTERNHQTIKIFITDTGHGIPDQYETHIFQPFNRLNHAGDNTEGSGIGLALSKQLVELMGGEIGYHSEMGTGSTFWIKMNIASMASVPETEYII
ncbi:MAG: ATP-binding protein [Spirochaetia bacterium]|nr:ATP-binding protein [Spirochaetia bacterium]